MNIGAVAARSGVPPKTIRYYEDIRLIRPARGFNGYCVLSEGRAQARLPWRARSLGFSIEDRRALLSLYEKRGRASADVKEIGADHLARIDAKMRSSKRCAPP